MNALSLDKQAEILAHLVEGNSIRATVRLTGASKNTISRLLTRIGYACENYQYEVLHHLPSTKIQCDEIWSFCKKKEKNVKPDEFELIKSVGDMWTWIAICADTKLVPVWYTGQRTAEDAHNFMFEVEQTFSDKVQITTDGLTAYKPAIERHLNTKKIKYATLVKNYSMDKEKSETFIDKRTVFGKPNPKHISTSFCERQNLTMRMSMRRFTRKSNGFSKCREKHEAALSLHFMWYNFVRIHQSIKTTPAIAAGKADRVWTFKEIAALTKY